MDGDTRDLARRVRMADNQRIRAYRAGTNLRRSWEAGDPGRGGKPWRPFCRELWEQGREDARLWQHEDRQERELIPAAIIEREKAIYRAQLENAGKPAQVLDKIVDGKLNSFYEQSVLLDQLSIRDQKTTIGQMVTAAIAKLGENITVARFVRFRVGEKD
jgi:hypothetical protein